MEPKEGNKIIAEFMGCSIDKRNATMHVWIHGEEPTMFYCEWHPDIKLENERIVAWEFAPHENWCQLMPVVEKIENCFEGSIMVTIKDLRCHIEMGTQYGIAKGQDIDVPDCYSGFCKTKIEAAFKSVIQFIQWYNKTKQLSNGK